MRHERDNAEESNYENLSDTKRSEIITLLMYAYYRFEVSGIASKVQLDVHNKPSIELSDKVDGKCYALCIFNSDEIFSKVSVGDRVVCRGNYLVASSLFGIVLKNNEIIEVMR